MGGPVEVVDTVELTLPELEVELTDAIELGDVVKLADVVEVTDVVDCEAGGTATK